MPDLDQLIAQIQAFIRGILGGTGGPRMQRTSGGRGLALLGIAVVALWLVSSFYRVEPDEVGVVMRFGAYSYRTEPGLHWHLPWPIEKVLLPAVTRINRTEIGYRSGGQQAEVAGGETNGRDVTSESLMLTGDENIIDINLTVFWKINNAADYLFNVRDPDNLVKAVAESSIREVIGRTPIQPALNTLRAADRERRAHADAADPGPLRGRHRDHPGDATGRRSARGGGRELSSTCSAPTPTPSACATRPRPTHNDIVPRARGDAARIVFEGQGAKQAAVAQSTGQAQQFDAVLKAYQAAKDVTLQRMYLDTMQDILTHSQPLVVDDKLKGLVPFLPLNLPPPGRPAAPPPPPSSAAAPGLSQGPAR